MSIQLLGKASSPEFWQSVRERDCYAAYRNELLTLWEKNCVEPIESLRYSDFRMFKYTGNRSVYESQYFLRRRGLCASALLTLIYPDEQKYLVRLMDTIYAICDEYTWCLPAHNTALEVNNNSHLDLFACETGFALAEIYTLLKDRLEPLICDRIRAEYDRRVLSSWNSLSFGWERDRANWNAVCTGSVACSLMLLHPELVEENMPRIQENIEYYLSGFEDDGICKEGVGYWHYGFGFFVVYADMIHSFTNGEVDYFLNPKVKEISRFVQKTYLSGCAVVSFSDSGKDGEGRYHLGLLHYLKDKYKESIVIPPHEYSYNVDGCGRWCLHLRSAMWFNEDYYYGNFKEEMPVTYYAEESQWLIHKSEFYGFAAKAGDNLEPHNHNDVGSFIIAKDGKQIFTDLGAGTYSRQYFSPDTRYDILQCSSRGHSVPIINGEYQSTGKEFAANGTEYKNGVFSADIAGAYAVAALKLLKRSFSFDDKAVYLKDSFTVCGACDIVERFVTTIEPVIEAEGVVKVDRVKILYDAKKCTVSFSDETLSRNKNVYFIDFKIESDVDSFEITFDIE